MQIGATGKPDQCSKVCLRQRETAIAEQVKNETACNHEACVFKEEIQAAIEAAIAPIIRDFSADMQYIKEHVPIVISWQVDNFEELELDHDIGVVTQHRQYEFIPDSPLELTLTAYNGYLERSKKLSLVPEVPNIKTFKAEKDIIPLGGAAKLEWEISGAKQIILEGTTDVSQHQEWVYEVGQTDQVAVIRAVGHFGTEAVASCLLKIARIQEFETYFRDEQGYQLFWSLSNISRIEIVRNDQEMVASCSCQEEENGVLEIPASDIDVHYELRAFTAYDDMISQCIQLKAVHIDSFLIDEPILYPGMDFEIKWGVDFAHLVQIDGGIGTVSPSGSLRLKADPAVSSFTIIAQGAINTVRRTIRCRFVHISPPSLDYIKSPALNIPELEPVPVGRNGIPTFETGQLFNAIHLASERLNLTKNYLSDVLHIGRISLSPDAALKTPPHELLPELDPDRLLELHPFP